MASLAAKRRRVWGNVWAERAAAALLEEQGQSALEQARLERRQRNERDAKNGSITGSRSRRRRWVRSTAMVDPPRQLLVSRVSERRVDRGAVLNGARSAPHCRRSERGHNAGANGAWA